MQVSETSVCNTFDAVGYGQWSFYGGVLICQLFNILICQLRKGTILARKWNNSVMVFGAFSSIAMAMAITYSYPLNELLLSKDNNFIHLGTNALTFGLIIILIDEIKKLLLRRFPIDE